MPPFECRHPPFIELAPAFHVYPVQHGLIRLISDPDAFRRSFARFTDGTRNGYSTSKWQHRGDEGNVIDVYDDLTVSIEFNDGEMLDFPFETVEEQLYVERMPEYHVDCIRHGRVRLLRDAEAFRNSFARFPGDPLDGYSDAKFERLGQMAQVMEVFEDDDTVLVRFDDGVEFSVPFETIEEQVTVDDMGGSGHIETPGGSRRRSRGGLISSIRRSLASFDSATS
mmetsp:Transcript_33708/g.41318  ORF Transcript_33708/g.41318 Transcript_33708/m.41318 type:complete len:225 (-) Transcript_33708:255-929(-)|eukprot:CAMPEP_0172498040 /NCGR_PEP_ID=MMETSP1066-20121228/108517_1 /TAXON_ID=671091 /ORGANISM="Coscinodiscus wailesii, Strain CCMP2513" /LENGTH=224 /DNA_ID=CAMNT_0013271139 /DNA_START=165 /DNA_END=839 /DNA_ORIENTATION=-